MMSCKSKFNLSKQISKDNFLVKNMKSKRYETFRDVKETNLYKISKVKDEEDSTFIINERVFVEALSKEESNKVLNILFSNETYIIDGSKDFYADSLFQPSHNIDFISKGSYCTAVLSKASKQIAFECNLDGFIVLNLSEKGFKNLIKTIE